MSESKVLNSIMFMKSLRETLCEFIDVSKIKNSVPLKQYVMNEASDYQILYAIVDGKFPKEKYNMIKEGILLNVIQNEVRKNYKRDKFIKESVVNSFLDEVRPLSWYDLSSAKSILEAKIIKDETGKVVGVEKTWVDGLYDFLSRRGAPTISQVPGKLWKDMEKANDALDRTTTKLANIGQAQKDLEKEKKVNALKGESIKKQEEKIKQLELEKQELEKEKGMLKYIQRKSAGLLKSVRELGTTSSSEFVKLLRKIGERGAGPLATKIGSAKAGGALVLGSVLVASLLGYGAYKTYQRFFSQAAKACKGSDNKTECMKQYRVKALNAQLVDLKKSSKACENSSNAKKCYSIVGEKMNKIKKKLEKARE